MSTYYSIDHCRSCGAPDLIGLFSLGAQYLATVFVRDNANHPLARRKIPLTLLLCKSCGLVQLKETVRRDLLFQEYFYRSATNPMMQKALRDLAREFSENLVLERQDFVLDIGCNDGTLLEFCDRRATRVGIEPARNIDWRGVDPSIRIVNDFFSKDIALKASGGRRYKGVTSVAMLYSVEDVNAFAAQVRELLTPDGIWCIQVSYLKSMLDTLSFYDICHEHLYYFSLTTLMRTLERHDLEVFDASTNDVNGGSLRVFAGHRTAARPKTAGLRHLIRVEREARLQDAGIYREFFARVKRARTAVRRYVGNERKEGRSVIGLGASTKGNVLLQFFGLNRNWLPYISERNPEKVSLRTLGTGIELVSEEEARRLSPSCMLVLIWFFKDEVVAREREYLSLGGSLLFPMPYPHIVTREGERALGTILTSEPSRNIPPVSANERQTAF